MDDRLAGHLFVSKRYIGFVSESFQPIQLTIRREAVEKIVFLHSEYDVVLSSPESTIKITKISAEDKKKLEETISRDVRRLKKAGGVPDHASTLPTQNKSMQLDDMVNMAQEIMARNNKRSRSNERKRKKKDPELMARRRSKSLRNIKKPVEEEPLDHSIAIENLKRSSRKGSRSGDKAKRELRKKASAESGLKKSSRKASKTAEDIPVGERKHRKDSHAHPSDEKKEKEENQAEETREIVIESLVDIKPENPPHLEDAEEIIVEKPAETAKEE